MGSLRRVLGTAMTRIAPDWSLRRSEQRAFDALRREGDLSWRAIAPNRCCRHESSIAAMGDRILVVAGYREGLDAVLQHVDVFDWRRERWLAPIPMPEGSASTHLGCATSDDRWLLLAGGQIGPQCRPATEQVWSLDIDRVRWHALPPLPEARYAPVLLHARGRLHAIGGTGPERSRSRGDHWSLAIREGDASEGSWREEAPIPITGTHRGGVVIDDDLFVFGGQQGDVSAVPGDPEFTCDLSKLGTSAFADCFRFRTAERSWAPIAPMPTPVSHTDTSVTLHGRIALVVGGALSPVQCGDSIQAYDPDRDRWSSVGRLPHPVKNAAATVAGGAIHVFGGQRSVSQLDLRPNRVSRSAWKASIEPVLTALTNRR